MTETQRYTRLREILPFAKGATVDELIESQVKLMAQAQQVSGGPEPQMHRDEALFPRGDAQAERTWQTQQLSPEGATTQQEPPGDKP